MLTRICIAALLFAFVCSLPQEKVPTTTVESEFPSFEEYCKLFNKNYQAHEINFRKTLYEQNVAKIIRHNGGTSTHRQTINQFADQTEAEFSRMFGYNKAMGRDRKLFQKEFQTKDNEVRSEYFLKNYAERVKDGLPNSIDWSQLGATTPVKNQGACGSCWAFAGTEAIESDLFLEAQSLVVLAPQVYVDCVQNPNQCGGSGGCNGATCDLLFDYAMSSGSAFEPDYPYTAKQGQCHAFTNQAFVGGYTKLPSNDDISLLEAVVKQPITISVAASKWAFYGGGVFNFTECDSDINHAVLLVGYGTDPVHGAYWKVQNSWGPTWGENGFIRLSRTTECAVDYSPQDGTACKDGPSQVTVCGTCGMLYDSVYPTGSHFSHTKN